tara:strand:+ start:487 stop:900 length:414 start_codon:yes stop_codon:yes gene_type:complete
MDIDYTVTALMFPAIPLIMNVYSTRFHTLSALIRKLHDEYVFEKHIPPEWEKQLHNLNYRTTLLKFTMGFSSWGFLFNMLTVLFLYLDEIFIARLVFGGCCVFMIISIFLFLQEIRLSTKALKFHLTDMKSMSDDLK